MIQNIFDMQLQAQTDAGRNNTMHEIICTGFIIQNFFFQKQ